MRRLVPALLGLVVGLAIMLPITVVCGGPSVAAAALVTYLEAHQ